MYFARGPSPRYSRAMAKIPRQAPPDSVLASWRAMFTIEQIAQFCGVSPRTVDNWIAVASIDTSPPPPLDFSDAERLREMCDALLSRAYRIATDETVTNVRDQLAQARLCADLAERFAERIKAAPAAQKMSRAELVEQVKRAVSSARAKHPAPN